MHRETVDCGAGNASASATTRESHPRRKAVLHHALVALDRIPTAELLWASVAHPGRPHAPAHHGRGGRVPLVPRAGRAQGPGAYDRGRAVPGAAPDDRDDGA